VISSISSPEDVSFVVIVKSAAQMQVGPCLFRLDLTDRDENGKYGSTITNMIFNNVPKAKRQSCSFRVCVVSSQS